MIQLLSMLNVQVLARQQIELLTAQAWLTENKDLEQKVVTTSYITLECLDGLLRSANFCPCILDLIVFFFTIFLLADSTNKYTERRHF